MIRAQIHALVAATRLPPNFTIDAVDDLVEPNRTTIRLTCRFPDSDPGAYHADTVTTASQIDPMMLEMVDPDHGRHLIFDAVRDLWLHELYEWVTFSGEHYHEPHNADGTFRR